MPTPVRAARFQRCLFSLSLALVLSVGGTAVGASPRGIAKHKEALAALKESRFAKARRLWIQAYVIDQEPKYLYNIARMSQELDRPVEALEYFEKFLKAVADQARYARQVERAKTIIGRLEKEIARLTIATEQTGVKIFVDRKALGEGPLRETLRLRPGKHVVTASLKGHHGQTRTVYLGQAERQELRIQLQKIKRKLKVVEQPTRIVYPLPQWLPWTGLSVGLVLLGGAGGSIAAAYYRFKEYDDGVLQGDVRPRLLKQGNLYRDLSYGLFAVGGLTAIAGVAGIIINRLGMKKVPIGGPRGPAPARPRAEVIPLIGPTSLGVLIRY